MKNSSVQSLWEIYEAEGETALSVDSLETLYYEGYVLGSKALLKIGKK